MTLSRGAISLLVSVSPLVIGCSDGSTVDPVPDAPLASAATNARIGPVGEVEPFVTFDAAAGELPEGIAVTVRGDVLITLAPLGQVVRIAPDGSRSLFATLDAALAPGVPGALGLATTPDGRVYVALTSFNPATHGVYELTRSGEATRLTGSEAIVFPNGLALDPRGNLYVTDSVLGAVWRIPRDGPAEPWIQHALLEGTGAFGLGVPIGANGIAVDRGTVYVLNSEQGLAVRIPVGRDGSAGEPELVVGDASLFGMDGLALDVHGRLYAAVNVQDRIVRIDPASGEVTELATDGLDFPAALAFGTGRGLRKTLFIANFALLDDPAAPTPPGPGVVTLTVGVPGMPLP